jgi:intracellular sulfur oxidation DsrE/DsrF family protein
MKKLTQLLALTVCLLLPFGVMADHHGGKAHKLVIQVSTNDAQTQKIALNNAVNAQKDIGMDNISIEIVAYGPGLSIMTAKSPEAKRVSSLAQQGITFSACNNTMKKMAKKSGKMPVLAEGVGIVPAGVIRIMELQEQGYAYVRP